MNHRRQPSEFFIRISSKFVQMNTRGREQKYYLMPWLLNFV